MKLRRAIVSATFAMLALSAGSAQADVLRRDIGRLPSARPVEIGFLMRHRNEDELTSLVRAQSTKGSPLYRHFLSTAQWNGYFAPTPEAYAQAQHFLTLRGFRITGLMSDRSLIRAAAPAALVERFFATRLRAVAVGADRTRFRNERPATIPSELRAAVVDVAGLDTTAEAHTQLRVGPVQTLHPDAVSTATPAPNPSPDPTLSPVLTPEQDYTDDQGYGPAIWAIAYDFPVQHHYGGHGQSVGTVIAGDFSNASLAYYLHYYAIPRTGTQTRVYTGGASTTQTENTEADLDAEVLATLAPAANLVEYVTPNLGTLAIETAYAQVVSDDTVSVVNSSFGECETYSPSFEYSTNYLAEEGAAKGITFVASAGDAGATDCGYTVQNGVPGESLGVSVPCADTYFVCVGGTSFAQITSLDYYTAETAWIAGGGGVSVLEPLPSWQAATSGVIAGGRNVPDLAFTANIVPPAVCWVYVYQSGLELVGGTSVGSPMFVALQAEINQVKNSRAGLVTPSIYAFYDQDPGYAFRDVTVGNNGTYFAKKGYDNTTGMGSPLGWELAGVE